MVWANLSHKAFAGKRLYPAPERGAVYAIHGMREWQRVEKSRKLWLVQFYRDDCSFCEQMADDYIKAAGQLQGLVGFAVIDYKKRRDFSKKIAERHGFKLYATPMIYSFRPEDRPEKMVKKLKSAKRVSKFEDERTFAGLVKYALARMPNKLESVTDQTYENFLSSRPEAPKFLYFTSNAMRGITPPVAKALSNEFQRASVGEVKPDHGTNIMERLGLSERPALVYTNASMWEMPTQKETGTRTWAPYNTMAPHGLKLTDTKQWMRDMIQGKWRMRTHSLKTEEMPQLLREEL